MSDLVVVCPPFGGTVSVATPPIECSRCCTVLEHDDGINVIVAKLRELERGTAG
jgi:hypothetical protein